MELNENLKINLIRLRKDRGVTQDVLAAALDISVQAISKWETGISLPDIMQLPRIAKFYGVAIDYLFYNDGKEQTIMNIELPNDDTLRIMQFRGNKMLRADLWEKDKPIELSIPKEIYRALTDKNINIEIWGSSNIEGDIGGNVDCGGGINCGNIGGNADSGSGINCGNIGGHVDCGGGVNCGNIGAYVDCGGGVNSGNIGGNVDCGGSVSCGDISGNVESNGDLKSNNIQGQVICEGNIRCKEIHGDVKCEGNITYEK